MAEAVGSVPLRTVDVDLDALFLAFTETPHRCGIDADWKEWRAVVKGLRQALREREYSVAIPPCREADAVEMSLARLNALIANARHFPE